MALCIVLNWNSYEYNHDTDISYTSINVVDGLYIN